MNREPEESAELPMEVVLREGRDPAQHIQIELAIKMPIDVIQHPAHPAVVIGERGFRHCFLRGETQLAGATARRSTDLALFPRQSTSGTEPEGRSRGMSARG